jgi:predicted dehydrogenase
LTHGTLIVGLGQIGMGYDQQLDPSKYVYSQARAFHLHTAFHLVAGVDPDRERRRMFESTYQRPAFAELDAALAEGQPEVVVVATPTPVHGETVRRVLNGASPRAILCEKPLSYDLAEARAMVKLCADAGVALYVNYIRRADPGVIEVRRRIDSGEIGSPMKGVCWYSKGLIHNGSHFVNLLQYWLGELTGTTILDPGRSCGSMDREPDARLVFDRGTVVLLAAREEDFSHHTIELVSANGRLRYERGGRLIEWQCVEPTAAATGHRMLTPSPEVIASGMDRYQWHIAEQLADALNGEVAQLCDGAEALRTLESLKGALEQ